MDQHTVHLGTLITKQFIRLSRRPFERNEFIQGKSTKDFNDRIEKLIQILLKPFLFHLKIDPKSIEHSQIYGVLISR